jgi:subtilisin family serine protease
MATHDLPERRRPLADHPAPLGPLAEIFQRRRIAVGIDAAGQVVLARPDSVLAAVRNDRERNALVGFVEKYDKEQAEGIRGRGDDKSLPFETVSLAAAEPDEINGEPRWSLRRVDETRRAIASLDTPIETELNHVVFGEQVVRGNPLGAPANAAGEMTFLGRVAKTAAGNQVLLSTAEPAEAPRFLPKRLGLDRRPPRILVLDTGLRTVVEKRGGPRRPDHPLLGDCRVGDWWRDAQPGADGSIPIDDEDEPDDDITQSLDFEAGHGTFIAGVIAQICPDAEIETAGVLSSFGDGDVSGVVNTLRDALRRAAAAERPIDIVVMSFGAHLADDEPGLFGEAVLALLGRDVLGVAAAGNQATCRPFYPAALPGIVGVGAVSAAGRAWFSNFGGWVDACAPGVDVLSTFLEFSERADLFAEADGFVPRVYERWASWSGTSFSAPKVAAVLAQEMYLNLRDDGADLIDAHEAWRRLSTHDRLRVPDLGVVFNA